MCKRHFDQFTAQAPQYGQKSEWALHSEVESRLALMNTENRQDMDVTVGELVAAGGDLKTIGSKVCQLTNDLHPMFKRENICVCKLDDKRFCYHPDYACALEADADDVEGLLEPTWPHPLENIILRPAMQLATLILEHKETLPFWAAIFDHGYVYDGINRLRIRHRKRLSPEAKTAVLDKLKEASKRVRFHFKTFENEGRRHFPENAGVVAGFQQVCEVGKEEPEFDWDSDSNFGCGYDCDSASEYTSDSKSDLGDPPSKNQNPTYYGWANGKPTTETGNPAFSHIWIGLNHIAGYDSRFDVNMTISQLRAHIVMASIT